MVSLAKEYEDQGVYFVASHVQSADLKDQAIEFVKNPPVNLAADIKNFCVQGRAVFPNRKGNRIPHVAIYDKSGEMVYQGSPRKMEAVLDEILEVDD